MDFLTSSLKEIIAAIKSGKVEQKEVYDYFLNRIRILDPKIESFNTINESFEEKDLNSFLA